MAKQPIETETGPETQPGEEQLAVPSKRAWTGELAKVKDLDQYAVYETPTSPSAVPGNRGRSRRARLGTVVNKTPYV